MDRGEAKILLNYTTFVDFYYTQFWFVLSFSMVQPEINSFPLMQMASGDQLSLQIYKFHGETSGKKAYVQANLHGAEIAGNAVIYQLIQWLMTLESSQLVGEIWLVPLCNPLGVNARTHHFATGRYSYAEGHDWNRIFWDYEKNGAVFPSEGDPDGDPEKITVAFRQNILKSYAAEKARLSQNQGLPLHLLYRTQLQSLAIDADYLIDLHTSSNQGLTYLYYFKGRDAGAKLFDLDFGILLDAYDGDAFDEAFIKPWIALEDHCAQQGRPLKCDIEAYTLEIGTGMKVDPGATAKSLRGLQNYLIQKGLIQADLPSFQNGVLEGYSPTMPLYSCQNQVQKYYATAGGVIQQRVKPGDRVQVGDVLYQLLSFNKTENLPKVIDIRSNHSGFIYDVSTCEVMNQGEYVLGMIDVGGE